MCTNGMRVTLNFLAERICQPCKSTHAHSHGQILPLHVASRYVLRIGVARTAKRLCAVDLRRAVAPCRVRNFAVHLAELSVIDISTESGLDGFQISSVPVARDLNSICQTLRKIADKLDCGLAALIADAPRWYEFRISADGNPSPNVTSILGSLLSEPDVSLFRVNEAPNLVELKPLARQFAECLILICGARFAHIDQQLVNCVDRNVSETAGCAKAVTFNEKIQNLSAR